MPKRYEPRASRRAARDAHETDVAEQRLIELFNQTRVTEAGPDESATEPLGVVVTVDVELEGMRNKPVLLSWSMWQLGGATRLHSGWLNTNLAYRLVATTLVVSTSAL